jgi:putative sigma-54 modulation protein
MEIDILFRNIAPSQPLREHVEREVRAHLSGFGDEITEVFVRIGNADEPRGGIDRLCRITVMGPRIGAATREELHINVHSAVDLAASRVAYAVGRELERLRRDRHFDNSLRRAS